MKKIAVDVVLLPPETIMDGAVRINQEILKISGREIELNKKTCLPHISLAMGCIEEAGLGEVAEVLQNISKEFPPISLQANSFRVETIPTGKKCSTLVIGDTKQLQRLHEKVTDGLKPFFGYNPTLDTIYGYPEVAEITLYWVKNYFEKSSFKNFNPHITVGLGETNIAMRFPISFTASTLALCHLGNYCTCRKILFSVELSGD